MSRNLLINTGNILSLDEAKKKASQNTRDELVDTLKIILREEKNQGDNIVFMNGIGDTGIENTERAELKVTVKVFVSSPEAESLKDALDKVFEHLNTDTIESLVIAYTTKHDSEDILMSLKSLWRAVEEYVKVGKLSSVGLSDLSTNTFIELFQWANVKPAIVQINLATCCVVPPALQEFSKANDVQLLTHSDPSEILPEDKLKEIFGSPVSLHWVVKYQIHLKCRGDAVAELPFAIDRILRMCSRAKYLLSVEMSLPTTIKENKTTDGERKKDKRRVYVKVKTREKKSKE
ncbi:PREDICTED: glutamate--cysteine ligase regulatory subunit isoform X2 [Polistes dominula]|uniref:GCS light chain n=1 Tax=Polistes dominula TaxID=743375 RepID=A0ABM1IUZ7_POLDO|nr:PREDICTED: glutamate--cysteine ligase regulatory subunit isoform X2 [Polistes dominula]